MKISSLFPAFVQSSLPARASELTSLSTFLQVRPTLQITTHSLLHCSFVLQTTPIKHKKEDKHRLSKCTRYSSYVTCKQRSRRTSLAMDHSLRLFHKTFLQKRLNLFRSWRVLSNSTNVNVASRDTNKKKLYVG